jgi:hypothetical protein
VHSAPDPVQATSDPECSRLLKMTPTISSAGRSASRDLVSNSKSHDWPARRGFVRLALAGIGKNFRGAGAMGPGTPGSQPTSRTTDLQADAVAGCKQDPPTRPAEPRPSGGCRGYALSGGRGVVGPVPCAGATIPRITRRRAVPMTHANATTPAPARSVTCS